MNRLSKRVLIFFLATCLVLIGGTHARSAYRKAKAKKCIACARLSFELKEMEEAAGDLQTAIQADPSNSEATALMAELLETRGSHEAIRWRIRTTQLDPSNMSSRLDLALTAVKFGELKSARDALAGVDEKCKSTARYHKVAAALAWNLGKAEQAQSHYEEARRLEPDNPSTILNLDTIGLVSTNREEAEAARMSLQQLSTNSVFAIRALRDLALDAGKRRALAEALNYTKQIVNNSASTFSDKLNYLNLLRATQSEDAESWLAALEKQGTNSPSEAFALGRWLARNQGPTNALQWLSRLPVEIQTKQPVPLVVTECQIALKDWAALASTLENEDWRGGETLRLAMQSLAQRSLGREEDAQSFWRQARRESTRRLDRLYSLTQLTGAWGWAAEQKSLLNEIVSEFPREKWAAQKLVALLHDSGETEELEKLLSKLSSEEPANLELKTSFARVCLLRKCELSAAHRLAQQAYATAPENAWVLSTYAYSLFLQGRRDEAVGVLDNLKPQSLKIPSVAAWYGVIEAEGGHKEVAREPLEQVQSAKLLPEERELVRLARLNL